ncbi:MAG: DUF1565 domain-containing protein [Planctomycetota bacterium]
MQQLRILRNGGSIVAAPLLFTLVAAFAGGHVAAQQTQQFGVGKIWVDANFGDDNNTGTASDPLRTITIAMTYAWPIPAGYTDMVIMLKPGIYKDDGVDEVFPIEINGPISIQGTSALNTIIEGRKGQGIPAIRYRALSQNACNRAFLEGVNIFHGDVGIQIVNTAGAPYASRPTISNCFITDQDQKGVEIVSAPNGATSDEVVSPAGLPGTNYIVHRPKFINCTFEFNRLGVVNHTIETSGSSEPVGLTSVSQPGFLNTLWWRSTSWDLMGVDQDDMLTFNSGFNCIYAAASLDGLVGIAPESLFDPDDLDAYPMFVGDAVSGAFAHDLRLHPLWVTQTFSESPVDRGHLPTGASEQFRNGTTAQFSLSRHNLTYWRAFDNDCEGFHNPRVNGSTIDIGADEVGDLVTAGYTGYTTTLGWFDPIYRWVGPGLGSTTVTRIFDNELLPTDLPRFKDSGLFPFSSKPPQTVTPYALAGLDGLLCVANYSTTTLALPPSSSPSVTQITVGPPVTPLFVLVNEQVVDPSGISDKISNLQSFTVLAY